MNGTSMFVGGHKTGVLRVLQAAPMARRDPVDGHARVQLALLGVQFSGGGGRVNSGVRRGRRVGDMERRRDVRRGVYELLQLSV